MSALNKVKEAILNYLDIDRSAVTSDSVIDTDLGADKIAVLDILMDLELAFDLEIPEKKIGLRVGDIADYIASNTQVTDPMLPVFLDDQPAEISA